MGCSLCKQEYDPDIAHSVGVVRNYFDKKSKNLERIGFKEKQNRKITSQIYKQILIDLLQKKQKENEECKRREQETYLPPFRKIVENTNPQKYESLILNLIAAKSKTEAIMRNKARGTILIADTQDIITQDRDELFKDMIYQEYRQNLQRRQNQTRVGQGTTFLQSGQNFNNTSMNNLNIQMLQNQVSAQQLTSIQRPRHSYDISTNSYSQALEGPQSVDRIQSFRIDQNHQQSNIQSDQFMVHTMIDHNREFQSKHVQVQKYLFNYLYEKISNNQHIVKNLIDEFGVLINEKFKFVSNSQNEIDSNNNNNNIDLDNSQMECYNIVNDLVMKDILFLIDLIKEYLKQIYGENVLPQNQFDPEKLDVIFDVFVRKIVFDNCDIGDFARMTLEKAICEEQNLLQNFAMKVSKILKINNAFLNNPKLKFLSNLDKNPFEELDSQFFKIRTISSPFLKKFELANIRHNVIEILKIKMNEQNIFNQLVLDDCLEVYYFIFIHASASIYTDVKFIEIYNSEKNNKNDFFFVLFFEVLDDILQYAKKDQVEQFIQTIFFNNAPMVERSNLIKEEDESASLSQISRLSSQHIMNQESQNQNFLLQQNITTLLNNGNLTQSTNAVTQIGNVSNDVNNQQLFFHSDILSQSRQMNISSDEYNRTSSQQDKIKIQNKKMNQKTRILSSGKQNKDQSIFRDFESQQMISTEAGNHSSFNFQETKNEKIV